VRARSPASLQGACSLNQSSSSEAIALSALPKHRAIIGWRAPTSGAKSKAKQASAAAIITTTTTKMLRPVLLQFGLALAPSAYAANASWLALDTGGRR